MLGHKERGQGELFITGSLWRLLPDEASISDTASGDRISNRANQGTGAA